MANQNPNGRTSRGGDGNRNWRPYDEERTMRERGHEEEHGERSDRERMTEHYGGGQSGYGSGRYGEDRSMGPGYRNQEHWRTGYEDRQGMHTDDRFTGRGGEGYWEDRTDRTGYNSGYNQGGMGYGAHGNPQMYRGGRGSAQMAHEYNEGRWEGREPRYVESREPRYGEGRSSEGRYPDNERYGMQRSPMTGYGQMSRPPEMGYTGPMGGHRGKGPVGYTRSDERIRETVSEALTDDDMIDATHIEVIVKNGEVLLTGWVEDRRQKRLAEDLVERQPGVREVQNQLRAGSYQGNQREGSAVGRNETDKKSRA